MKHLLTFLRHDVSATLASTVGSPSAHRRHSALKHLAFMLLFLLGSLNVWGETVTLNYEGTGSFPRNPNWTSGGSESSSVNHTVSGTYCAMFATTSAAYITYNQELSGVSSISLYGERTSNNTTHPSFAVEGSTDGGNTWSQLVAASTFELSKNSWTQKTISISPSFTGRVRLKYSCSSSAQKFIDDIVITYTPSAGPSKPTV